MPRLEAFQLHVLDEGHEELRNLVRSGDQHVPVDIAVRDVEVPARLGTVLRCMNRTPPRPRARRWLGSTAHCQR
jgi:hypothetical protein